MTADSRECGMGDAAGRFIVLDEEGEWHSASACGPSIQMYTSAANERDLPTQARSRGSAKMPVKQGSLDLLQHPTARELLESKIPARVAYVWTDGTPRVIPIWFHWNGTEFVIATPPKAPKLKALAKNPKVSLTIDDNSFPHKVLLVRGTARMDTVDGVVPEYAAAAERYFGREQGRAWVQQLGTMVPSMVRIAITPEWVGLLDFQTRFPSALPL